MAANRFPFQEQFGSRIKVIARPADADTATCRGAAQYGLARRPLVSSVISPRAYLLKVCGCLLRVHSCFCDVFFHKQVKLPVEPEDRTKRPAYINRNEAGYEICENRCAQSDRRIPILCSETFSVIQIAVLGPEGRHFA
jgi:hypothetical protein